MKAKPQVRKTSITSARVSQVNTRTRKNTTPGKPPLKEAVSKQITRAVLIALLQCDGLPMEQSNLITSVQLICRPRELAAGDIEGKIKTLSGEGYIATSAYKWTKGRTLKLTSKGTHKARKLR